MCIHRHRSRWEGIIHPFRPEQTSSTDRTYIRGYVVQPIDVTSGMLEILNDVTKRCDPCQRIQSAPLCFSVPLGAEQMRFNEEIYEDIMYNSHLPTLYFVDTATRFGAAELLGNFSTLTVQETFVESWADVYLARPNRIRFDRKTFFIDSFMSSIAQKFHIHVGRSGIGAHSSLGIRERYHKPVRDTFRKVKIALPKFVRS